MGAGNFGNLGDRFLECGKNIWKFGTGVSNVSGWDPATFCGAFMYCEALTTIPETLFDGITGDIDEYMFYNMFEGAERLSAIPNGLFDGLTGASQTGLFSYMFSDCYKLTGNSAKINGEYLYNRWPNATSAQVGGMYMNDTRLTDYVSIPSAWK